MIKVRTKLVSVAFIAAYAGFTACCQLQAQDIFRGWNGSVSDDWMNASNWDGGVIPGGATDTASIRNSTNNRTVLYSGANASLDRVYIGEQNTGHLTVQTGASLTTARNINVLQSGGLVNNGVMSVADGLAASGSSSVGIGNGGIFNGQITANGAASVTIDGRLNGNFNVQSSARQQIGASGVVNGDLRVGNNDIVTIAGEVSGGLFNVNGNGSVVIESTATILSEGGDSWLYNTANVTWNVGADGSVGTLRTNRDESTVGAFDGVWRYDATTLMTVVLDVYDAATHGETITMSLVSDIQNANTFAGNVKFLLNGQDISGDFTHNEKGSFTGTIPAVPEPATYPLFIGCLSLVIVCLRCMRAYRTRPQY